MQRVRLAFQAPAAGLAQHVAILAGHMLAVIGSPLVGHRWRALVPPQMAGATRRKNISQKAIAGPPFH